MKVKDLIEKLQKFDPESPILVDGYEWGYDEPILKTAQVYEKSSASYGGNYDNARDREGLSEQFFAVIVGRFCSHDDEDFAYAEHVEAWKQRLNEEIEEHLDYRNGHKSNDDLIAETVKEKRERLVQLNNPVI